MPTFFLANYSHEPQQTFYAAPDGSDTGAGTEIDPFSFDVISSKIGKGDKVIMRGGIYLGDELLFGPIGYLDRKTEFVAYPGERPIMVHSDGEPPMVNIRSYVDVDGIWFGGSRPATEAGRVISVAKYTNVHDCTFYNYTQAITTGDTGWGGFFRRNRFVKCGWGTIAAPPAKWHPIYVATSWNTEEDKTVTEENIFIACEGYFIHYYHEPQYGLIRWNFAGDSAYGLAVQQGPHTATKNIIWITDSPALYYGADGNVDQNVWKACAQGPNPGTLSGSKTLDGNYFIDPQVEVGTNPVTWLEADVVANLGNSSANIDAAISALETAFAQTVQQIHDDATIETHFATLKAVIDTWKAQP